MPSDTINSIHKRWSKLTNACDVLSVSLLTLAITLPAAAINNPTQNRKTANSTVFVITNRQPKAAKLETQSHYQSQIFGKKRAGDLAYGFNKTTVKAPEFYQKLSKQRAPSPSKESPPIVVFVHGYNCNMKIPGSIAAQLEQTLQLPVVMFSWPSKRNPFTYAEDECTAEWSSFQFAEVLEELDNQYGNSNIVLVGHSMGCRIICWALQHRCANGQMTGHKYKHIFFCAPDMDSQIFEKNVPMLTTASDNTTVFASSKDVRLFFSKVLHGHPRLGLLKGASNETADWGNNVKLIDYTANDQSIFGHAIPYQLIEQQINTDKGPFP